MPACGVSFTDSEYDAAQALLDLQSHFQGPNHENSDPNETNTESAKILLNCFEASNVPQLPKMEPVAGTSGRSNTEKNDVASQTEDKFSVIKSLEITISQRDERIKQLREKIEACEHVTGTIDVEVDVESIEEDSPEMSVDDSSDDSADSSEPSIVENNNFANVHRNRADDMVPIGSGNTMIPRTIYQTINWDSHTSATRKLLSTVFPRSVLATHSLTGRPSPAFPNRRAKRQLNQTLVNDIVKTVSQRCCVAENLVRACITIKCADECKMLRMREKKSKNRVYRENISPETDSDGL